MGSVSRLRLPQLVPLKPLYHFSPFCPYLELLQNASNEPLASHRYAFAPFRLSLISVSANGRFNPLLMAFSKLRIGSETTTGNQPFSIYQNVSLWRILDLVVTAVLPRRRVLHHTISDHVQIDVYHLRSRANLRRNSFLWHRWVMCQNCPGI